MSSISGPITRSEVIARAQNWVDRRVPYSWTAFFPDPDCGKTYRQDCSGYVSMCWHLDTSLITSTLPGRCVRISFAEVKAGDALAYNRKTRHIVIAAGPPSGGYVTVYHEPGPGGFAEKVVRNITATYDLAYRYNNILEDTPPTPPSEEDDMILVQSPSYGIWSICGNKAVGIGDMATVNAYEAAGVRRAGITDRDMKGILATLTVQELIWNEAAGYAVGTPAGRYHRLGDNEEVNYQRSKGCVERNVSEETFRNLTSN